MFVTNLVCREKLGKAFKRHKSRRYWITKFQAYKKSGLGPSEFCQSHGLARSSFYRWFNRLEAEGVLEGEFIPVEVEMSPVPLVVEGFPGADESDRKRDTEEVFEEPSDLKLSFNGGIVLSIPKGFDPLTLRQIVEVLSPC
jgi:hypothetical protein